MRKTSSKNCSIDFDDTKSPCSWCPRRYECKRDVSARSWSVPAKTKAHYRSTDVHATAIDIKKKIQEETGITHIRRTKAFKGYAGYTKVNDRIEPEEWREVWKEMRETYSHATDFTIASVERLADRYGETKENFRAMANDLRCPAPVTMDGPVWGTRLSHLDSWYKEADRIRRIGNRNKGSNLGICGYERVKLCFSFRVLARAWRRGRWNEEFDQARKFDPERDLMPEDFND